MEDYKKGKGPVYMISIMSSLIKLAVFLFIFSFLQGCRSGGSGNTMVVTEVIDGNKVRVANGKVFGLIGVFPNYESKEILARELINEVITYQYDSKFNSFTDEVYVYMNRQRDGLAINRLLLSKTPNEVDTKFLFDSLSSFKNTIGPTGDIASVSPGSDKRPAAIKPESATKPTNIIQVIKRAERGVFLIRTKNTWGKVLGTGTGFFISNDGIAVSNYHVFEGGSSWDIKLFNEESFDVTEILVESPENDFIIFKVDIGSRKMAVLTLGNGSVDKGEEILVLGNPKGLEGVLTKGIVSSSSSNYDGINLIQIDAAISPGSSGSPVMRTNGEVIGVATLKFIDCENCNFAVNINDIKRVLNFNSIDYNEY
jgi:serine protease Do